MPKLFDFSILHVPDLLPFLVTLAIIMVVSFLAGTAIKGIFRLNKYKWLSFATPIGFLFYMGILQIGYTIITYKEASIQGAKANITANPDVYLNFTKYATIFIVIGSVICFYWIWESIKNLFHWKNLVKPFIAFAIFAFVLAVWKDVEVNYRLDDINFYEPFIIKRITAYPNQSLYIYQGYYTFLSVLKTWFDQICGILGCEIPQDIVYALWMPAVICIFLTAFAIVDLEGYVEEKINFVPAAWLAWIGIAAATMLDYWYFQSPANGNTLRHICFMIAIPLMDEIVEDDRPYVSPAVAFVLGAGIALSSSAFFLDMILLYCYTVYAMLKKHGHWLEELAVMLFFPLLFVCVYMPQYMFLIRTGYIVLIIFCAASNLFHFNSYEKKMMWPALAILIAVPLAFIILSRNGHPDENTFNVMSGGRGFWESIGTNDQIPDILHAGNFSGLLNAISHIGRFQYNIDDDGTKIKAVYFAYWIMLFAGMACWWKKKSFPVFMAFAVLLTFFNPFVYRFVVSYITGSVYLRITDLLFNPPVMAAAVGAIASMGALLNQKGWQIGISCGAAVLAVIPGIIRYQSFDVPAMVSKDSTDYDDFNYMYKTSQTDIDLVRKLETYLENDEDIDTSSPVLVVSQIYGAQFFTESVQIGNTLGDRFSFAMIDNNEFERTFLRRLPGVEVDDSNVDYRHACSLAFARGVKYVLLDGQYDGDLQYGLWPCSNLKDDLGVFKIIKMDSVYWDLTLHEGYTLKYSVEDNNVTGIDTEWYRQEDMEVPKELPEDKEEQEKALAEMLEERNNSN